MRRWIFPLVLLAGSLALAACAAQETPKEEAAPAAPAPAPAAAPEAKPAWEQEWERVLEAAKREGSVVVGGPLGPQTRTVLTEAFAKKYGITVELSQMSGSTFLPRIQAERAAGQYLWDIYVGGATTIVGSLREGRAVDPLEPALILPEVKDPKNWQEGRLPFIDKDRTTFSFLLYTTGFWQINPSLVKAEEFKSWKDLLDPKWKGKLLIHDPRISGGGQSRFQFFYLHPQLGMDFIRALAPQLVLARNFEQELIWLAAGRYPILLGGHEALARQKMKEGLPIAILHPQQLREGGYLASGGSGNLGLVNKAPHPNAAKVYINWLLGKEGQTLYSKATGSPSWRADVPTDHVEPALIPQKGTLNTVTEEAHLARAKVREIAQELFGR